MIRLINIDKKNYQNIISLDPGEIDKKYVDNIADCILEYLYLRKSIIKAIYLDDTPIGFVMIEDKHNNKWIRQFLIDKKYQNKGFGQIALKLILRYIQKKYQSKNVYLSTNNELAIYIYLKFGFNETNDKLNDYYKTHFSETVYSIDLSKFNFNIEIKMNTRMSVVQI